MASPIKNANFLLGCLSTIVVMTVTVSSMEPPNVTISFPDIGDYDFLNESMTVMTNSDPVFELLCEANYPVEWIFHYSLEDDGISEGTKLATTYRHVQNFSDVASYKFRAKLRLEYKGKLLSLTNFTCRHAEITYEPPIAVHPDWVTYKNCSGAVAKMGRRSGGLLPCNKCEFPETGKQLELDYLRCLTPIQCASTYNRQNKRTDCLQREANLPKRCKQVDVHFNPTILVCKNYGPALAQFYFFGVFRGNQGDEIPGPPIYFDWAEVISSEMLYIHPFSRKTVFTGEHVEFTCEYSRYYFSIGSWFGVKNKHGTKYIKATDLKPCDTEVEKQWRIDNCTLKESWRGTYWASLNINFNQVGSHQVFCLGPVWNSTEWVNASVSFDVEEGEPPRVLSLQPDKQQEFVVGQENRTLTCKVTGKPAPQIVWTGPNNETTSYKIKQVDEFTSEIIFNEIGHKTSGKYTCLATSYMGGDIKTFQLKSQSENSLSATAITAISLTAIVFTVVSVLVIVRLCRIIKIQKNALRLLTEAELNEFVQGNPHVLKARGNDYLDSSTAAEALPYDAKYEIPVENLEIEFSKILGSGEYGLVVKGKVHTASATHYVCLAEINESQTATTLSTPVPTAPSDDLVVAVKVSKGNLNVTCFKALLTEIKVMAYLGTHRNVASLVGASTKNIRDRELYIAVEFCENGSLDKFLKKHKQKFVKTDEQSAFTVRNLLQWSVDVADGMEYIHEKKIIHADLAIRNVLLTQDLVAKVADFGLSRISESSNYTKTTKCALPWRSMAIESLKNLEFSAKSDIWAFGITLWEIFTLGDVPYPGVTFTIEFPNILEQGLRLYKPPLACSAIYDYMLMCWSNEPSDRPGTNELKIICLKEIDKFEF